MLPQVLVAHSCAGRVCLAIAISRFAEALRLRARRAGPGDDEWIGSIVRYCVAIRTRAIEQNALRVIRKHGAFAIVPAIEHVVVVQARVNLLSLALFNFERITRRQV